MKKSKGSILAIVVIMVGALYLLAGMLFIVNQQYFSDMFMARSVANNRQKLLSAGQESIQQASRISSADDEQEPWKNCDAMNFPDIDMEEDIFLQKVQLANHCHDGHFAHRIWLASLDNLGDRLVIDQLMAKDDWQSEINDGQNSVRLINTDNAWQLMLSNGVLTKEVTLIESDDLPQLVDQAMRIHHLHYEIVLAFEDKVNQQVMLYHLWIPIEELHFDISMIFQFHLSQYSAYDHSDIVTMSINDARNPNWQMKVDQKYFDAMLIKNNVIFTTLHSKDQTYKSIIGVYLKGQPFFDERLVGFEYKANDEVIELIPCLYRLPLIVAGQWQIGCDIQQKIRYYFPE